MRTHLLSTLIITVAIAALVASCGGSSNNEETRISGPSAIGPLAEAVTPAGGIQTPTLQGGAGGPDASVPSPNLIIELTARNSAFSETELQAPAYAQVSVIFENDDRDSAHSFSLYRTPNGENPVFVGGIVPAQETRTFTFTTPEPGTYYFRDDLMPGLLNGTLETK
jgi:hypothetical protein